ncbi:MAG: phage holin family protein [Verrucomicrobiota bacterium JB022]|nr:phage holin family protein [Verrucomicrobiota bacterium JB022]
MAEQKESQGLFLRLIVLFLGTWLADQLVDGIHADGLGSLALVAVVLAVLNAFVRPLLIFFTLPLVIFTLGLAVWLINAVMLLFAGGIVPGFHVDSFWSALWGAIIIGIVSMVVNLFTARKHIQVHVQRGPGHAPDGTRGVKRLRHNRRRGESEDVIDV